jgi:hypothetical protein
MKTSTCFIPTYFVFFFKWFMHLQFLKEYY